MKVPWVGEPPDPSEAEEDSLVEMTEEDLKHLRKFQKANGRFPSREEIIQLLRTSEDFQNWVPETDGIPRTYSPQQIAKAWKLSPEFIRLLFINEPGVLRFSKTGKSSEKARQYTTIRIPKPVLLRVFKKWQKVSRAK